jgi:hypothetical protein
MSEQAVDKKRLELRGQLPTRLPYQHRAVAHHLVLAKDVEFRIVSEQATTAQEDAYKRELILFTALDLPGLDPVLDRGGHGGRIFYCVPLHQEPWLDTLGTSEDCTPIERWTMVNSLATLLGGVHARGQALGPLLPEILTWNQLNGQTTLHFLPEREEACASSVLPELPAHLLRGVEGALAEDVVHWAWFSYWVLSRGQVACSPQGSQCTPLGEQASGASATLQDLIDACLGSDPRARPRNGVELSLLLRNQFGDLLRLAAQSQASEEQENLASSIAHVRFKLEESGSVPSLSDPAHGVDPLRMTGLEISMKAVRGVTERTHASRRALLGLLVVGILVGVFLGSSGDKPPPPTWTVSGAQTSLPQQDATFRHASDPFLVKLVNFGAVTPGTFKKAFIMLRNLSVRRRLPKGLGSFEELRKLDRSFQEDATQGCDIFNALLKKLRQVVPPRKPKTTAPKAR